MSASKFFRNFLMLPQMRNKENSCHPIRGNRYCDDDPKIRKTQGSAFPAPESNYKSETHDPLIIVNGSHLQQENVSQVASTTGLRKNAKDDLGMQYQRLDRLGLVGTIPAKNRESSICGTEEKGGIRVNTVAKEVKNESKAEYEQSSSAYTESATTDVGPIQVTSLEVMVCERLKGYKTEEKLEEVTASNGIFDELFQKYVNTLHVATKTNEKEDLCKATNVNTEQQEHLNDVPIVNVSFPEATKTLISFPDSAAVEQTQNLKCVHRLSTAFEKPDSPGKSIGVTLIVSNGFDIQKKNTNGGSNGLKPVIINDDGGTSETTAGEKFNPLTFHFEIGDIESSTGSPSEKTKNDSRNYKSEAAEASDGECSSIASSNTEIYEEANCQDIEISEEETQDVVIRTSVNDLPASVGVQPKVPGQTKLNKNTASCSGSVFNNAFRRSCDNLNNEIVLESNVAIVRESRISTATRTETNLSQAKENSSKSVNRKRISLAAGIIYEDEVSSPGESQSCHQVQASLSSDYTQVAREVSSPSSRHTVNSFSKLPFCATLVTDRDFSSTADMDEPCVCVFCGKAVFVPDAQQPGQKQGFSSMFCYLCLDKLTHPEQQRFSCNICDTSFKARDDFINHCKVHTNEAIRIAIMCYICKKVLNRAYAMKQHIMSHSGDTPFSFPEEKKVSTLFISQCSTMTQTLLSSDHSGAANGASLSFTRRAKNDREASSKVFIQKNENPLFPCERCGIRFGSQYHLSRHRKTHSRKNAGVVSSLFTSPCSTTTQTLSDRSRVGKGSPLSIASQGKDDRGATVTFFNKKTATTTSMLLLGATLISRRGVYRIKDKERPFACGYCGRAYKGKKAVYRHIRRQHDDKRYSCEFCGKRFAEDCDLSKHVTIHTQEKPFACDQCGMRFRLKQGLRQHKFSHSEERLFPCNICGKSYKTSRYLLKHSQFHNKAERGEGITCSICKFVSIDRSLLKQHMRVHTGEKPFKCTLCDKQYSQKGQLRYHMETHNGKKRHVYYLKELCSLCGKSIYSSYMPTHMRMHSGEKPFECNICFKRFPKKTNLEGHMRSHTGEKPFACSRCDKRFALYSNMVTHKAKCSTIVEKT